MHNFLDDRDQVIEDDYDPVAAAEKRDELREHDQSESLKDLEK